MQLRASLLAAGLLLCPAASWAQDRAVPVPAETIARFKVTVTADQQIAADVYEFMTRVERRNEARARLGAASASPELELVHLISSHAKMAPYQRDPGLVFLRLDQQAGKAAVEYCLGACDSKRPVLAVYGTTIAAFTKKLAEETGKLAKYRAR
jgi:hypothetical protein